MRLIKVLNACSSLLKSSAFKGALILEGGEIDNGSVKVKDDRVNFDIITNQDFDFTNLVKRFNPDNVNLIVQ